MPLKALFLVENEVNLMSDIFHVAIDVEHDIFCTIFRLQSPLETRLPFSPVEVYHRS